MAADLKAFILQFKANVTSKLDYLHDQLGNVVPWKGLSPNAGQSLTEDTDGKIYFRERTPEEIAADYEGIVGVERFTTTHKLNVEQFANSLSGKADLDPVTGKVLDAQLPDTTVTVTGTVTATENTFADFLTNVNNYSFVEGNAIIIVSAPDVNGETFTSHYLYNGGDRSLEASYSKFNADRVDWVDVVNAPDFELKSNKGAANGYTPLGSDSKVPAIYLPDQSTDLSGYALKDLSNLPSTLTEAEKTAIKDKIGAGGASERTLKVITNTTQYTYVAEDFTSRKLLFSPKDANGNPVTGATIEVILNTGITDVNGAVEQMCVNGTILKFVGGTGVTINPPKDRLLETYGDGAVSGVSLTAAGIYQVYGDLKNTVTGTSVGESLTGNDLNLSNAVGNNYNYVTPSGLLSYTTNNPVVNGFARCFINAASEPVVYETDGSTPATQIGSGFVANSNMEMVVESPDGVNVEYYFLAR